MLRAEGHVQGVLKGFGFGAGGSQGLGCRDSRLRAARDLALSLGDCKTEVA